VRPKAELLRLVEERGRVVVDPAAVLPGRGAYVCDADCAERAIRRRAIGRALRGGVEIPPDFVESVRLHGEKAHP
jgi:predicted RNA-binding protein YlxR (DUF448 family)